MRTSSKIAAAGLISRAALLMLLLTAARAGFAELITPAKRELVQAERKLVIARGRVTVTAEQLSAAQSLRMARLGVFHACQAVSGVADRVRKEAEKAEASARDDAAEAEKLATQATQAIDGARKEMERARDRFLDRPLAAYDFGQHGRLTFNVMTGAIDVRVENGPGIQVGAGDVEALLSGRFKRPELDSLQLAIEAIGTRGQLTSNYNEVRERLAAEHGAANVYLLSRRFLEWASPERLAGGLTALGSTRGSAAGELSEAQRQVQLEFEDLAAWLSLKGIKDFGPSPAAILVDLIRTGSARRLGLSVKTTQVEFAYRLESPGRTDVPLDYLGRLRPRLVPGQQTVREVTEKRPALAIVWTGPQGSQQWLASRLDGDFRFSSPAIGNLSNLLPSQTDPRIRRILGETARLGLLDIDASAGPRRLARTAIGPRKDDIGPSALSKRVIVDLRKSDLGEIITSLLNPLALGNRNACDLNVLELDQSNGRLEAGFTLRHRHTWPTTREALARLRAALGPVGTEVEDLADRLPDAAFDAARKRYHEADAKAHESSKLAYQMQQLAHDAADRVATKGQELAILAGELARAESDLRTATEREAIAKQDAQTACAQLVRLDGQLRVARYRTQGAEAPAPGRPVIYGSRDVTKKW